MTHVTLTHFMPLCLIFYSQFGFYDDNETVVEIQHQEVSLHHVKKTEKKAQVPGYPKIVNVFQSYSKI